MRVMIVDDQPRMRAVIREAIAPVCRDVVECSSATEAIEKYPQLLPDWVTMDYRMEPHDGIVATAVLVTSHPGARVVIVTNYDEPELRAAAKDAGAVGFVLKEDVSRLPELLAAGFGDDRAS